jgi:DNA polymerase-1
MDDDVLSALLAAHPVVRLMSDYREVSKLRSTYTGPLPGYAGSDGRVRTTLKMNVARTGRLASEKPNLQNVSVRTEDGRQVRAGFISRPGCVLVSHDLSQIEMVWAAELSQDSLMCEVFHKGQDIHVRTACGLFRLDYDRIAGLWKQYKAGTLQGAEHSEMRDFEINRRLPSKTLGFAVLYGVTPAGLQMQILAAGGPYWTIEECEGFIQRWFDLFGGVADWLERQHARARRYGMVWTAFGRVRQIPEAGSALQGIVSAGLRMAGNMPDQGSAGDHLKLAMAELCMLVDYYRSLPGVVCEPLLQIHDELVFEVSREIADEFNPQVAHVMAHAVPMSMPVKSSYSVSGNWGGLK